MIYFFAITAEVVALLAIYSKNKKEDLSNAEKTAINNFIEAYKQTL